VGKKGREHVGNAKNQAGKNEETPHRRGLFFG
jgi:hypothetical protein